MLISLYLFFCSDGRISYRFNKDSITINIPLPYGGKSSRQVVPWAVRIPALELKSVGISVPSQAILISDFNIPENYQLRVPLIGLLDVSSNFKSNYYNWSASYSGGNATSDIYRFTSRYQMKADTILDILSYSVDGKCFF